jgi:peptidoglycan/LPS O-acetylase OafA/YrhL
VNQNHSRLMVAVGACVLAFFLGLFSLNFVEAQVKSRVDRRVDQRLCQFVPASCPPAPPPVSRGGD